MNSGTQAAKEAGNMVDLDNDPTKLIEIVEIGKQLLINERRKLLHSPLQMTWQNILRCSCIVHCFDSSLQALEYYAAYQSTKRYSFSSNI
jgi:hypothetical protein